jgi:hypothetical protein
MRIDIQLFMENESRDRDFSGKVQVSVVQQQKLYLSEKSYYTERVKFVSKNVEFLKNKEQ